MQSCLPLFFSGMKQINGWYNIHNFNNQCCGQIKVALIPSSPLSPSKSSKYFKKYDIVQPCNLDLAFFSTNTNTTSTKSTKCGDPALFITEETKQSSESLFEQLRRNLQDLDTMTRNIRNRTEQPVISEKPSSKSPVILGNSDKQSPMTSMVPKNTVDRDVQPSLSSLQEQDIDNLLSLESDGEASVSSTKTYTTKEELRGNKILENIQNSSPGAENVDSYSIPGNDQEPSIHGSIEDPVSSSSHGDVSGNETASIMVDTAASSSVGTNVSESLNDSTDDLLEHLKEFERKYKHLKTIVQNDSDFEDEDVDQVISSPAFSSPRGVRSTNGGERNFFDGSITAGDSFFDQDVINVSSGEPSKEEINSHRERVDDEDIVATDQTKYRYNLSKDMHCTTIVS